MGETEKSDREIFDAVLSAADPDDRSRALDRLCGENDEQRQRVQTLLDAFDDADGFMASRAPENAKSDRRHPSSATPPMGPGERPGSIIGNYKLLQEIGAGGFGVVYMAEQLQPVKRKVALKIIKPGMDTREVVARFESERQALALMAHPNIAQVFDGGATDSGRPYFVMELVKGLPITEFCDQSRLSNRSRLKLFLDVCSAIQHAHQKGVIHRDIKPTNVMVTLHDGEPVPKVIDFGIAKALNQELTERSLFTAYGQMIGTPQYASPEQAEMSGLDIDTRSDIYSLGVLLYELLTGQTPISREELKKAGLQEVQKLIKEREPTKPSLALSVICQESTTVADFRKQEPGRLVDEVKGDLDWIVLKALGKDRTRRYDTASDFAADVHRFLNNEPVMASPPTFRYLAGKFWSRNKKPLSVLLAIFVALIIGVVGLTTLYFRASKAEGQAIAQRESALRESARAEAEKENAQQARDAEAGQRRIAQASLLRVEETLARADFDTGAALLDQGKTRQALSYLARSQRTDPKYRPTAGLIVSALRDCSQDLRPEVEIADRVPIREFRFDSRKMRMLTINTIGVAQLWSTKPVELLGRLGGALPGRGYQFSFDGKYLVTSSSNGVVGVWNTETGQKVGSPIEVKEGVNLVRLASPDSGGLIMATLSWNGEINIWNALTGKRTAAGLGRTGADTVREFMLDPAGEVVAGEFDGEWISWDLRQRPVTSRTYRTHGADKTFCSREHRTLLECWPDEIIGHDLLTGDVRYRIPRQNWTYNNLAPLGDSRRVLLVGRERHRSDLAAIAFDVVAGTEVKELRFPGVIESPQVDPTGRWCLAVRGGRYYIFGIESGQLIRGKIFTHRPSPGANAFCPTGEHFAVNLGRQVQIIESASGRETASTHLHADLIGGFSFSPSGRRLLTRTRSGDLRVWDVASGRPITGSMSHPTFVGATEFDAGENRVFSLNACESPVRTARNSVRVWNIEPGKSDHRIAVPGEVVNATFGPNGKQIAVALGRDGVCLIDRGSRRVLAKGTAAGEEFLAAVISPDGRKLAALSESHLHLWELSSFGSGPPIFRVPIGFDRATDTFPAGSRFALAMFSHRSDLIATLSLDRKVRLWNANDGRSLSPPLPHVFQVNDIAFRPDDTQLMTMTTETTRLWKLDSLPGQPQMIALNKGGGRWTAAYNFDGSRVLNTGITVACIWNADTGKREFVFPHRSTIRGCAFSADGRKFLTAIPIVSFNTAAPGTVILWDLATRSKLVELPHADEVCQAAFAPDGVHVVTAAANASLRIWDAAAGKPMSVNLAHSVFLEPKFKISSDSRYILSITLGMLRLYPMPFQSASPDWLPDLAEAVAGQRLNRLGLPDPIDTMPAMRRHLDTLAGTDEYSAFARRFLAEPSKRGLSPDE